MPHYKEIIRSLDRIDSFGGRYAVSWSGTGGPGKLLDIPPILKVAEPWWRVRPNIPPYLLPDYEREKGVSVRVGS